MFIFASSVPAENQSHWMMWVALLGTATLFLLACIMIVLLCLTNRQKLTTGPFYVRRATDILKWVAFVAPTLMLFGCLISFYNSLNKMGIRGEFTIVAWAGPIGELLISTIIGFGVSLLSLIGIAIHFYRTRHS